MTEEDNLLYKNKFRTKSCRYDGWDYSNEGYYFITICTHDRIELFGEVKNGRVILNEYGKIVEEEWKKSDKIRKAVETNGRSSLQVYYKNNFRMEKKSISSLMAGFKSVTTKIINKKRHQTGEKIWQGNYYDRIIRTDEELNRIRQYIIDNSLKWNLDRNNPNNC